jgi:hypothetical protein
MSVPTGRREFLALFGAVLGSALVRADDTQVPPLLDHFILGCSDLDAGISFVEQHTGIRAAFGGVHPGRGTRNALLSLGPRRYLEIMAPDPQQNVTPQIARLPELKEPRIVGWAVHVDDIEKLAARLREQSIEFIAPRAGSRQRPDGKVLHWKSLTLKDEHGGLLPFFIEWSADSVHPSTDAPQGCQLDSFSAVVADVNQFKKTLERLSLKLSVDQGPHSMLRATLSRASHSLSVHS